MVGAARRKARLPRKILRVILSDGSCELQPQINGCRIKGMFIASGRILFLVCNSTHSVKIIMTVIPPYLFKNRVAWKTWKKGNFFIKSGKTMKRQGKKLKKHREKSGNVFVLFVCFSGMHKIASSGQNFRGHCFAYLLNLLSTLLRRSANFHE